MGCKLYLLKVKSNGDRAFGKAYNIIIDEGLLASKYICTIYIFKNNKIVYNEIIEEIADEPDYEKAIAATK